MVQYPSPFNKPRTYSNGLQRVRVRARKSDIGDSGTGTHAGTGTNREGFHLYLLTFITMAHENSRVRTFSHKETDP